MAVARGAERRANRAPLLLAGCLLLPLVAVAWVLASPERNRLLVLTGEHFVIVTFVSLLAAGVSALLVRVSLRADQLQVLLLSLGFLALAGFFTVHALATPGMLHPMPAGATPTALGDGYDAAYASGYGFGTSAGSPPSGGQYLGAMSYGGTLVGLSAFLSLGIPSLVFALANWPPALAWWRRGQFSARTAVLFVLALLLAYGALGTWQPDILGGLPLSSPPASYGLATTGALLLTFAAWSHWQAYRRTRFPVQLALTVAFLLLAEAQVLMVAASFWTVLWWGYHALMLVAVFLAIVALFVEMDRRRGLERFLPSEVVERVVAGDPLPVGGERRVVTIAFSDLRGSTALAETLAPESVVALLNDYVAAMARPVFEVGGMVDKFMGDGVMAIFGVMPDSSDGAEAGIRAALGMRDGVAAVNRARLEAGQVPLKFGVALHTGDVVLGAIGLPRRSDFTAIGDTVNTASRLESFCKEFDVDIVLSEDTVARLPTDRYALRELGKVQPRGRLAPVRIFTIQPEVDAIEQVSPRADNT